MTCLQVAVRPTLVPLTVDAIPDSALPYASLSKLLSASEWDKLCRTTARAANYRCCPTPHQNAHGQHLHTEPAELQAALGFRQLTDRRHSSVRCMLAGVRSLVARGQTSRTQWNARSSGRLMTTAPR